MKNIFSVLAALILLSLGACPSLAQYYDGYGDGYYDGYEEGYTCWMCPYCGFVILLDVQVYESATEYQTTLGEVTYLNPSDPEYYCPTAAPTGRTSSWFPALNITRMKKSTGIMRSTTM